MEPRLRRTSLRSRERGNRFVAEGRERFRAGKSRREEDNNSVRIPVEIMDLH